jgi:hypothetical protein
MLDETELKSLNNPLTKIVELYNTRFIFGIFLFLNLKISRWHACTDLGASLLAPFLTVNIYDPLPTPEI